MSERSTKAASTPFTSYFKPNSPNRVLPDVVLQIIFSSLSTQEGFAQHGESVGAGRVALESDLHWVYRACIAGFPLPESSASAAKMTELFHSDYWQKEPTQSLNLMTFTPHAQKLTKELMNTIPSEISDLEPFETNVRIKCYRASSQICKYTSTSMAVHS